jgi:L-alanine-DL-glutamate epimerase-like enolase superfamily enzyme
VPPTADAAALLHKLRALPLVVEGAAFALAEAAVPSYPGGLRPTSVVTLAGDDAAGYGEHVGWTSADHERFRMSPVPAGRWTLGAWAETMHGREAEPYARAALESAAIDLALRQQGLTLFEIAGCTPRPVRYVVSFERCADPAAEAHRLRRDASTLELKIDVDPAWSDDVYAALAAAGGVAVLDFKETGADPGRGHRFLPDALLEDALPGPWTEAVEGRLSFDAPIRRAADIPTLPVRPAAVNVKPARMGGVLEALGAVAACQAAGVAVYFGGMFEVGVGRRQLHALAALFAADAPNDVAPIGVGDVRPPRPRRLTVDGDRPGFGPG